MYVQMVIQGRRARRFIDALTSDKENHVFVGIGTENLLRFLRRQSANRFFDAVVIDGNVLRDAVRDDPDLIDRLKRRWDRSCALLVFFTNRDNERFFRDKLAGFSVIHHPADEDELYRQLMSVAAV